MRAPTLADPPRFRIAEQARGRVTLAAETGHAVHVFALEDDIVRVLLVPPGGLAAPRSWAVAPGREDVPACGRDRMDTDGFASPPIGIDERDGAVVLTAGKLRATIRLVGLLIAWEMADGRGGWTPIARDRPTQAYNFGWWEGGPRHYLARHDGERYFGLGEKSGPLDRAGRRLRLSNTDALGYDAGTSDPLYKHIPFYITQHGAGGPAFGLFYDTYSDCAFDFGCERSNYHGLYRSFAADHGDLDYYVIAGPAVADVTRRFTWLTGRPALMPRWALDYSGSSMAYADAPDAAERVGGFVESCRRHDILCSSMHLSSGYTSIGPRRYVFHWNRDKFPDPAAFAASCRDAGVRLIANIKPCLLGDHPRFEEARRKGLLICDAAGEPAWAQFWDGVGAYLDFTNPSAAAWWRDRVTEELLDVGVEATWNDNNEFEVGAPDARAAMFGARSPAVAAKPLQTMLMLQASREAQRAHAPGKRPFLVSRAGAAGMQRYVQTWSGDNATSWETLRWNIRMGLGLALSGVSNSGHDIGGFAGPPPDAELFVRWVEAGVFMPRFSIHSWNDDGSSNEPWMHPQATAIVRDLIRLRAQLTPYLYDLCWRHSQAFEPIVRPTFAEFPDDPAAYGDCDDLMLGSSLLVASVVEPGATSRRVRAPAGVVWADFWTGARHAGGAVVELPAPWGRPPLLVREGSAIPLNVARQHFDDRHEERAFAIFAPPEGEVAARSIEDDGEREASREDAFVAWELKVRATTSRLEVRICGGPTGRRPALLVRPNEMRPLYLDGRRIETAPFDGWMRADP